MNRKDIFVSLFLAVFILLSVALISGILFIRPKEPYAPETRVKSLRPTDVLVSPSGMLYVTDVGQGIVCITQDRGAFVFAGGRYGFADDGPAFVAGFYHPESLVMDTSGNLYITEPSEQRIRRVDRFRNTITLAGQYNPSREDRHTTDQKINHYELTEKDFFADGPKKQAKFDRPTDVAVDQVGNVYVTDSENNRIRKITPKGYVTTLAGGAQGLADGKGNQAQFNHPIGIAMGANNTLYVADANNNRIRTVSLSGEVKTLLKGVKENRNAKSFSLPMHLVIDGKNNIYLADGSDRIFAISDAGNIKLLAGSTQGFANGQGKKAKFNWIRGLGIDQQGNIYAADYFNNAIRKITPTGLVTTIMGKPHPVITPPPK